MTDRTVHFVTMYGHGVATAPNASESAIDARWYKKIDPSQNYHTGRFRGKLRVGEDSARNVSDECLRIEAIACVFE